MTEVNSIVEWLQTDFLRDWKQMLTTNHHYVMKQHLNLDERMILFPFIPKRIDGYSFHNFLRFIIKYLFPANSNFLILVVNRANDSILWGAIQKSEGFTFTELIEISEGPKVFSPIFTIQDLEAKMQFLQAALNDLGLSAKIGFYCTIDIDAIANFKHIYENIPAFLQFYSKLWGLISIHFQKANIVFYPEPLLFKFLRRLSTRNLLLPASEFELLLKNLLPTQNLIVSFIEETAITSIAFNTTPNGLQLEFLDFDFLQTAWTDYQKHRDEGLEYFNKLIKNKTRLIGSKSIFKPSAAITLKELFWLTLQKIMTRYNFEFFLEQYLELGKSVEEQWTIEQKIVLFRHWGKNFLRFQLSNLLPLQIPLFFTSILSFQNPAQTKMCWFIVDDQLQLLSIIGIDYISGLFNRIYAITDPVLFELFNGESNKSLAVKKAHLHLAETQEDWIDQICAVTVQDLNLLIASFPLLTSIKGSLKYLSIIENIISLRMYFYPPNFFADLIAQKGAIYFFKNIFFSQILKKSEH